MLARRLVVTLATLVVTGAAPAGARPVTLQVSPADAACPNAELVTAELRATLPQIEIADGEGSLPIAITDEGAAFDVQLRDDSRRFEDPGRNCLERARKAAVYLSLVLEAAAPSEARAEIVPPSPPPTPLALARPLPTAQLHWPSVQLEVGALFAAAPSAGPALTGGASVRLFVGARYVGAVLGIAAFGPATLRFDAASAHITRVPFSLGIRGRLIARRVVLSLDATIVLGAQLTEGVDLPGASLESRLELGIAATLRAEYWVNGRIAPYVQLDIEGIPGTYMLSTPDVANVGRTPSLWLSAAAGVAVRVR